VHGLHIRPLSLIWTAPEKPLYTEADSAPIAQALHLHFLHFASAFFSRVIAPMSGLIAAAGTPSVPIPLPPAASSSAIGHQIASPSPMEGTE
jgi:hypothetical protein